MTVIEKRIRINAEKQVVWQKIADLGGIQDYNPGVRKSYVNTELTEGKGSGRICEFHGVGIVDEVATEWRQGEGYTLKIVPVEKIPFFKEGHARFTLRNDNSSTLVEMHFEYTVKGALVGPLMDKLALKAQFAKGFEGLLKGLKIHVEEGRLIDTVKDLKGYQITMEAA